MRNLIFLVFALSILACKTDKKQPETPKTVDGVTTIIATDPSQLVIPDACQMITAEDIKSIFGVPAASINIKHGMDKSTVGSNSCFFKWEDKNTPNAGIMLMIQTNPLYSEAPNFFTLQMESSLNNGETVLGHDEPSKYKKFNTGSGTGIYCFNLSTFQWTLGNDYKFTINYNISTISEDKIVSAVENLARKVNANFASKVKK